MKRKSWKTILKCSTLGISIILLLIMNIQYLYGQAQKQGKIKEAVEKQWWYPILKDQGINTEDCITTPRLCITGDNIEKDNQEIVADDAFILIKKGKDKYQVLKSSQVTIDLDKDLLHCGEGTLVTYLFSSPGKDPVGEVSFTNIDIYLTEE